ncbi:VOC family protein [Histidinibacterium aquaticum]|uniref:Glutathione transferase n=1 Tax=Histidinibacterium aquaticum TaxID=2613962 RepID=A0A5J5GKK2_9RHOB|nr:VOC family protein [Histidinibacterium aquaticum]KAA9008074.1 glutathione transferase [Histidinibacterium aquaticum]
MSRIRGLNHLTLAVTDLNRSLAFYRDLLGCTLRARWPEGAYLEAGDLWICLALDPAARARPHPDYSHVAFTVAEEDIESLGTRVLQQAESWRENRSEGASIYVLDPDGHRLELHSGSLKTRLAHYRADPDSSVEIFEP